MRKENLEKLAFYFKLLMIDPKYYACSITCTKHDDYLEIFLEECDRNDGVPLKYSDFRDELWRDYLHKDPADCYPFIENNFENIWNGWKQMYNYLKGGKNWRTNPHRNFNTEDIWKKILESAIKSKSNKAHRYF